MVGSHKGLESYTPIMDSEKLVETILSKHYYHTANTSIDNNFTQQCLWTTRRVVCREWIRFPVSWDWSKSIYHGDRGLFILCTNTTVGTGILHTQDSTNVERTCRGTSGDITTWCKASPFIIITSACYITQLSIAICM